MGIDKIARKAGNELGQQEHHGAQQCILGGRILDVGQGRQVGNERGRSNATGQVVGRYNGNQGMHVVAMSGQPGKQQIAQSTEQGTQHQNAHHPPAQCHHTAHKSAQKGHQHAIDFGHAGHFGFGETHVDIKRIGHDAHHHIADSVDRNQTQNQSCLPFVALHKVDKGIDQSAL